MNCKGCDRKRASWFCNACFGSFCSDCAADHLHDPNGQRAELALKVSGEFVLIELSRVSREEEAH